MSNQRSLVWLGLASLFVFATALVVAEANRKKPSSTDAVSKEKQSSGASQQSSGAVTPTATGAIRVVRFAVYPQGIRPNKVQVTAGPAVIYMEDSGDISEGLLVRDTHGLALGRVARVEGKHRGSQRLNLKPGEYRVVDAGRPQNYATLLVK